jgi:hypothetical protein
MDQAIERVKTQDRPSSLDSRLGIWDEFRIGKTRRCAAYFVTRVMSMSVTAMVVSSRAIDETITVSPWCQWRNLLTVTSWPNSVTTPLRAG